MGSAVSLLSSPLSLLGWEDEEVRDIKASLAKSDDYNFVADHKLRNATFQALARLQRINASKEWGTRVFTATQLGICAEPSSSDSDSSPEVVSVASLSKLLGDVAAPYKANPGEQERFADFARRAWDSTWRVLAPLPPDESTHQAGAPHSVINVLAEVYHAASGGPSAFADYKDGRSFPTEYEAMLRPSQVHFFLELTKVPRYKNESACMAEGLSRVIQRLSKHLTQFFEEERPEQPPTARYALGAATNGLRIVFVRLDVNTGKERWHRPFILSRSPVLPLFALSSRNNHSAYSSATQLEVAEEPLPAWMISSPPSSPASPSPQPISVGFFGLALALSNTDKLWRRVSAKEQELRGIWPPPVLWNDGFVPTGKLIDGGFARIHLLQHVWMGSAVASGEEGEAGGAGSSSAAAPRQLVWKTVAEPEYIHQLEHEYTVLTARIPRHPSIIRCLEAPKDGDGKIAALVLEPVGQPLNKVTFADGIGDFARLLRDMSMALRTAHAAGICHCDLRPHNIIAVPQDDEPPHPSPDPKSSHRGGAGRSAGAPCRYVLIDWGSSLEIGATRTKGLGCAEYLHDDVVKAKTPDGFSPYSVQTSHDWASLAFTLLAMKHGEEGHCPWEDEGSGLLQGRHEWMANWLRPTAQDGTKEESSAETVDDHLRRWATMLLTDKPDLIALDKLVDAALSDNEA